MTAPQDPVDALVGMVKQFLVSVDDDVYGWLMSEVEAERGSAAQYPQHWGHQRES